MAFGKVIVRTESGETLEYELSKPTTSIGRLPGNDIVLSTSAVSRYHAQLEAAEGRVFLVDLGAVNGTFLNDHQIDPDSRVPLSDGDVIGIGDVRLTFNSPEARERYDISLMPTTAITEDASLPFRFQLDEPQQAVAPGARLQLAMLIENLGADEQLLVVEMGGLERDWAKANRREVRLEPGEQTEVLISVRPPRSTQTRPGLYPLTVRVASKADPSQGLEAVRGIDVVGYSGLAVAVQGGSQLGLYHIAAQNQGNTPVDIQLEGHDSHQLLKYRFEQTRLHLEPGETKQISLKVSPINQTLSLGQSVQFAVVARSLDEAGYQAPTAVNYVVSPEGERTWLTWLAGVGLPLLLGSFAALAVAVVLLLFGFGVIRIPGLGGGEATGEAGTPPVVDTTSSPEGTQEATVSPLATAAIQNLVFQLEGVTTFRFGVDQPVLVWSFTGEAKDSRLLGPDSIYELPMNPPEKANRRYVIGVQTLAALIDQTPNPWSDPIQIRLEVTGLDDAVHAGVLSFNVQAIQCVGGQQVNLFPQPDPNTIARLVSLDGFVIGGGFTGPGGQEWVRLWEYASPTSQNGGWAMVDSTLATACLADVAFDDLVVIQPPPPGTGGVIEPATEAPGGESADDDTEGVSPTP